MKFAYEIEDISSLDESVKGYYEPFSKEGKTVYRLSVDGVKPIEEFDAVYNSLKAARGERDGFEKSLKSFGEYTPEKIKAHPWWNGYDWDGLYQKRLIAPFKPELKDNGTCNFHEIFTSENFDMNEEVNSSAIDDDQQDLFGEFAYSKDQTQND